ncbi:MAG: response regulator [Thermodesulfobacteriota bacterium]
MGTAEERQARTRILVVEDDPDSAAELKTSLEAMGYLVPAIASDGREAVDAATRLKPDLILMDIMLGREGPDGIEAAAMIADGCAIPVIYLTAHADDAMIERAKSTRPYGYLLKPHAARELKSNIEMALAKRQAELLIQTAKQEWETTFDAVPDCIAVIDADFRIRRLNRSMRDRLGRPYAELIGRPCYELLHTASEPPAWCPHLALDRKHPAPISMESYNPALGGWFQITVTPVVREAGGRPLCVHVARDISPLKKAEAELKSRQVFLQGVVDAIDDALMVIAPDHSILLRNAAAARGGDNRDKCFQCSHGVDSPCKNDHPCPLDEVRRTGRPVTVLHHHQGPGGESVPVEISASPLLDAEGRFQGIVEVARDVGERLRSEEERRIMAEKLFTQMKSDAVCRLAGGIAHQFNNLLMAVIGNAEMLALKNRHDEEISRHTGNIIESSKRMADLTRQMVLYAAKDEGKKSQIDLTMLVGQVLDLSWSQKPPEVEVERRLPAGLWPVHGDPKQLIQLLMSLLVNAYEAMAGKDGRLSLAAANFTAAESWRCARLHDHGPGDYVRITVTDSGGGITARDLAHIFEPFFSRKFLGRGLGLAVADSVAAAHHGCLSVQSRENEGTTMTVLLPRLAAGAPALARRQPASASPGMALGLVLVVDDEADLGNILAMLLEEKGARVLTANTGAAALELFAAHRDQLALVLLDVQLPDMNGLDIHRALRRLRPEMPILLMSGHDREAALGDFALGARDEFIAKPCDAEDLYRKIDDLCQPAG